MLRHLHVGNSTEKNQHNLNVVPFKLRIFDVVPFLEGRGTGGGGGGSHVLTL